MPVTTIRGGRQITDGTIPYADIQSVTANTVLANNTASATAIQEVALSASNLLGRGTTGNIAAITVSNGIEFTGAVLQTTANLRSLNGLSFSSASFVKMTGANTFTLDTNTYYLASNPSGYTSNTGTVTSVGGTGTVSGLTLSGTVTTSGNLTLGGTLSASIDNITDEHRLFNNMGDNHGTRTSFDASTPSYNFGWRYVQGSTNGPGVNSATQYYHLYVGLGNDYLATGAGSYGMQIAIPRNVTTPYIAIRYNENNSLASWQKISAGYADTSGNSATTSQTNFSSLSIGGVAVATQGWVQSQGYITSYTETDTLASVTGRGATTSTAVTFNGGLSSTSGSFSGNVTWSGSSSGNPRAIAIGYSGSNYGQIGYGIAFTGTSGAHNYAINDFVTRMDFYDGIQVYAAVAGSVGAPISWTEVLYMTRGGTFRYLGSNIWTASNLTNLNQLSNGPGYITSSADISGYSGALIAEDNRTIAPSELTATRLKFGFTSWNNDNNSPYADFLHLRSYADNSGGNDNLVLFRKDAIGMRIYQQTFGSSTAYSSFKDIAFTDGTNASGTWGISVTGNAATVTNGMYLSGDQNISGVKTFYTPSGQTYNAASGNIGLTVFNDTAGDAMISFHIANDYAGYFGLGGSENDLVWTGWSVGNVRHRIWHSGNDGSGSTLDADTLDTYHASNFAFSSGSNASGTGWNISILGSAGSVASSATFNNGGSGASSGTTYNGSSAVTVSWNTVGALPTPRTTTTTATATLTPDVSTGDVFTITAQNVSLTVASPTGTPYNGQKIIIRIKDNGSAKSINWTTGSSGAYRASSDLSLPITTIAGKTIYLGFIWNSTDSRWDLLAKLDNF
jgi:hypothetical protein